MAQNRRYVRRMMTKEDYANLLWGFDSDNTANFLKGHRPDLSAYNKEDLASVSRVGLSLSPAQKQVYDYYFKTVINKARQRFEDFCATLVPADQAMPDQPSSKVSVPVPAKRAGRPPKVDDKNIATKITAKDGSIDSFACISQDNVPIRDDDTLWQMYQEQIPVKKALNAKTADKMILRLVDYPFVPNPTTPISPKNLNFNILLRMLAQNMVSVDELGRLCRLCNSNLMSVKIDTLKQYGLPKKYHNLSNFYTVVQEAAMVDSGKYQKLVLDAQEQASDTKSIIHRYFNYLTNPNNVKKTKITLSPTFQQAFKNIMPDKLVQIDNDTITFSVDDAYFDDGKDSDDQTVSVVYTDQSFMIDDIILLAKQYNIDRSHVFNVFGQKCSVDTLVNQYYKRYPNGVDGHSFYTTTLQAFHAGVVDLD